VKIKKYIRTAGSCYASSPDGAGGDSVMGQSLSSNAASVIID